MSTVNVKITNLVNRVVAVSINARTRTIAPNSYITITEAAYMNSINSLTDLINDGVISISFVPVSADGDAVTSYRTKIYNPALAETYYDIERDYEVGSEAFGLENWFLSSGLENAAKVTYDGQNLYAPFLADDISGASAFLSQLHICKWRDKVFGAVRTSFDFSFSFEPDPVSDFPGDQESAYSLTSPPATGKMVYLTPLTWIGDEADAAAVIVRVLNADTVPIKVHGLFWTAPSLPYPSCSGPFYSVVSSVLQPGEVTTFQGPSGPATIPSGALGSVWFGLPTNYTISTDLIEDYIFTNLYDCTLLPPVLGSDLKKIIVAAQHTGFHPFWETLATYAVEGWPIIQELPDPSSYIHYALPIFSDNLQPVASTDTYLYISNLGALDQNATVTIKFYYFGSTSSLFTYSLPSAIAPKETAVVNVSDLSLGPFVAGYAEIISNVPLAIFCQNYNSDGEFSSLQRGFKQESASHEWLIPLVGNAQTGWQNYFYVLAEDDGVAIVNIFNGGKVTTRKYGLSSGEARSLEYSVIDDIGIQTDEQHGFAIVEFFGTDGRTRKRGFASSISVRFEGPAQTSILNGYGLTGTPS